MCGPRWRSVSRHDGGVPTAALSLHHAPLDELPPRTLYRLLQIRSAAFVVEQDCVYLDLDGLDLAPGCVLWWACVDGEPVATLRVYPRDGGRVLGRVATDPTARDRGIAGQLIAAAVAAEPGEPFHLSGQAHLAGWYERFGFAISGPGYLEDGIPHVPMVRPPQRG